MVQVHDGHMTSCRQNDSQQQQQQQQQQQCWGLAHASPSKQQARSSRHTHSLLHGSAQQPPAYLPAYLLLMKLPATLPSTQLVLETAGTCDSPDGELQVTPRSHSTPMHLSEWVPPAARGRLHWKAALEGCTGRLHWKAALEGYTGRDCLQAARRGKHEPPYVASMPALLMPCCVAYRIRVGAARQCTSRQRIRPAMLRVTKGRQHQGPAAPRAGSTKGRQHQGPAAPRAGSTKGRQHHCQRRQLSSPTAAPGLPAIARPHCFTAHVPLPAAQGLHQGPALPHGRVTPQGSSCPGSGAPQE
jgi:hypothetical protein